ncbi:MAG: bifunctional aspartate kinase/homoserine dehydrogenase I, partial [Saprospiraceae bacterium]|nr:bifunctional aspartate kinase/homoserine dehydrogenase I [Saprospiraceae bacterium]
GYTEPDPRIDLMGLDVRRKLVILAREAGLELESEQVTIDPFLPPVVAEAPSVEAFFAELEGVDQHFRQLVKKAEERAKVLRLVAKLENGEARIGLEEVGVEHPFYHLSGSDNMIVFTTERYKDRPLVVRGPGAGAEVTAAGLFAEIIGIGHLLGR